MSKLSLLEIAQSQLDKTPVIDGQLIVCFDTGNAYRDTATAHVKIGSDLEVVSDLPLAPLAEKIYYLKPDKLYAYLGGNWTLLNDKTIDLDKVIAKLPAGSSTALNDDVEIITQDTDTTQAHYYRRKLVVIWEYIKTKAQDFFAAKNHKHKKADITDFPTSMPASDVSAWAKAATKPSYTKAEVGLGNVDNTADKDKSVKYATSAGSATTGLNGVSTCIFDLSSNNGSCVRFYNGLQICFGNSSKSSGVVFKLPFANDNYAVVVGGSDTLKNAWYVAGGRTTTGFNPNQSGFAVLFHWIAIGNWK